MKQYFTLKSLLVMILSLLGLNLQAEISKQIEVRTAGTLPTLISSYEKDNITSLTLTGNLNGTDILFIREMAGKDINGNSISGNLSILDISAVNIVGGGPPYYYSSDNTIGGNMFRGTRLISISLPNSVTSIGDYVFEGCYQLTSVTIPNNVKSIGDGAFWGCSGLTSIAIPKRVALIGESAFANCTGLFEILVSEDNYCFISVDGVLFSKDKSTLISYPNFKSKSYTIPNSVTSISSSAFWGCHELTSVTIPNSVISIGRSTFSECSGLTSITIPDSVTSIGDYAFSNCTKLSSITIPNSVKSIGDWAFYSCSGLTTVTTPDSLTSIGRSTFSGCSGLTSFTIPNSVKSININAFSFCSGLTSITIPNSVKSISDYAFDCCAELASVTIGNSVTSIASSAFSNCTGLREIHNNSSIPQILGATAFENVNKSICKLYVPKDSFSNYLFASIWGDFDNIIEEDITSNTQIKSNKIKIYTEAESIAIEDVEFGEEVSIYTESGALIQKIKVTEDVVKINVPIDNVYLVNIAHRTFKVAL